jgi:O-antigen ligase
VFVAVTALLVVIGGFLLTSVGLAVVQGFVASNLVSISSSGQPSSGIYLADRDVIFNDALRTFMTAPLTGLGIGSYRGPFGEEYPHNLLLMYAVDAGAVALLLLLAMVGMFIVQLLRARTASAVGVAAVGVFVLVAAMFAGSYYDARLFWFMSFALLTASRSESAFAAQLGAGNMLVMVRGSESVPETDSAT